MNQVYVHNEALIQGMRHDVVDGFVEISEKFEDQVCFNYIVFIFLK